MTSETREALTIGLLAFIYVCSVVSAYQIGFMRGLKWVQRLYRGGP